MNVSFPVRSALAWKVAETLCRRRRPGFEMSVTILRPGGGQYFCVSVMRRDEWRTLAMLNLNGTSVVVNPWDDSATAEGWVPPFDGVYPAPILELGPRAFAAALETAMGLEPAPGSPAGTTPALLCVRLISAVMQRVIFSEGGLVADSGWFDSSGEECHVQDWVKSFPEEYESAEQLVARGDWRLGARLASCFWQLSNRRGDRVVLLDFRNATALIPGRNPQRLDLMRWYVGNGRRIAPIVEWLVSETGG